MLGNLKTVPALLRLACKPCAGYEDGGLFGGLGCFYCVWMFKGSLKTGKRFSGCLWLGGVGLKAGLGQIAIFRLPCGGKLGDVERG